MDNVNPATLNVSHSYEVRTQSSQLKDIPLEGLDPITIIASQTLHPPLTSQPSKIPFLALPLPREKEASTIEHSIENLDGYMEESHKLLDAIVHSPIAKSIELSAQQQVQA